MSNNHFSGKPDPTLHLMVGLPCSGKTTLARRLERQYAALRLTPDVWHTRLFGQDLVQADHSERHSQVEALMWEIAARVLRLGVNVILDFGCWSRVERDDFRARAAGLKAGFLIHFLDVSEAELLARLAARNTCLPPDTFYIPSALLKEWVAQFEPPAQAELEYTLIY